MTCFFAPCSGKKKDLNKCGVVGIQTLISKIQERDDSFLAELQSLLATSGDNASVTCHQTCYSSYTSTSRNVSVTNKRKAGDLPHLDEPARRTTRSQLSDFIFKREKAWPKAMRAFRMVVAALMHDFLQEGDKSHTDIATFLESTRTHPTGRLWTDCFIIPTMLAHQFMRAEREGDWILQQHCLKRMLPYFFVAGQHHYARYISWHLRAMQHIPLEAKQDLFNGAHVCRHTEGAAAVSGDQYGEQTYIKQGKQAGGLKGISTNPGQVAVWIESIGVCSHLAMAMAACTVRTHDLHLRQQM